MRLFGPLALLVLPFVVMTSGAPALAQEDPYQPPLFNYNGGNIDVLEAVRLTLAHDPNLRLQEEDVAFQEGLLKETLGTFEWTFLGNFTYEHERQELRQSQIETEVDRRDDLRERRDENCVEAGAQQQYLDELQAAQASAPGSLISISSNATVENQLRLVDRLILNARAAGDAAQEAQLNQVRADLLDREIQLTTTLLEAANASCQDLNETLGLIGEAPELEEFDRMQLDLRLERVFDSGLSIAPFLEGNFSSTQFVGKRNGFNEPFDFGQPPGLVDPDVPFPTERFVDLGGKNIEDSYAVRVGFDVELPLLRGRGDQEVTAARESAKSDLDGVRLLLKHEASRSVFETVSAFWNLLAAQQRLEVFDQSVKLHEELLQATKDLVQGDAIARFETSRATAGRANAWSRYQDAEEEAVRARLALAQATGIDAQGAGNLPGADGDFDAPPDGPAIAALDERAVADTAVRERFDIAAARAFVESSYTRAEASAFGVRARLDALASVWTTANGDGSLSEATDNWILPSWSMGLTYEKPLGNRQQTGRQAQAEAQVAQNEISAEDLERVARIEAVLALRSLAEAQERLARAEEASEAFGETVTAEIERFRAGESTLVDAIRTEQEAVNAHLALVGARQEVAVLLTRLRFETGTLVTDNAARQSQVSRENLTALPNVR